MPPQLFEPYIDIRNHIYASDISLDTLPPAWGCASRLEPWLHRASFPNEAINWASRPYPIDGVIKFAGSDEAAALMRQDHMALTDAITSYEYFPEDVVIDPTHISTRSLAGLFDISEENLLPHLRNNSLDIHTEKRQLNARPTLSTIHTLSRRSLLQSLKWHEPWTA